MILAFDWKSSFTLAILSIFSIVLGNILGGIIGDKIVFNSNKVLAFGLLTLALFVGTVLTVVNYNNLFIQTGLLVITLISAIILYIALIYYNKSENSKRGE